MLHFEVKLTQALKLPGNHTIKIFKTVQRQQRFTIGERKNVPTLQGSVEMILKCAKSKNSRYVAL